MAIRDILNRRRWLGVVLIAIAIVVAMTVRFRHGFRFREASLVTLASNERLLGNGQEIRVLIAANANDRDVVTLVLHKSNVDAVARTTYSSRDPMQGLVSSANLVTHYPPDPDSSGLWVDGTRIPTSGTLKAVYVSDVTPAEFLTISDEERPAFLKDARSLDPFEFVNKWIAPRAAHKALFTPH